jgi:hypothetical protein
MSVYAYTKLGRAGLGNSLFPWARALIASQKYDLIPLWPTWFQPRLGPLLRRERDKRLYFQLFEKPSGYVGGLRKFALLGTARRESEGELDRNPSAVLCEATRSLVIEFVGMKGYFQRIIKDHDAVRRELIRMTRHTRIRPLTFDFGRSMSVHLRMGEFTVPSSEQALRNGAENLRQPISWYATQIRRVRHACGAEIPAFVFSDGSEAEIAELLELPNTRRVDFGSSVGDLLALSRAQVLIASGSTFSMWASYLGRMPVIWYTGQMRQRIYYDQPQFEIQSDGVRDDPPNALDIVAAHLLREGGIGSAVHFGLGSDL